MLSRVRVARPERSSSPRACVRSPHRPNARRRVRECTKGRRPISCEHVRTRRHACERTRHGLLLVCHGALDGSAKLMHLKHARFEGHSCQWQPHGGDAIPARLQYSCEAVSGSHRAATPSQLDCSIHARLSVAATWRRRHHPSSCTHTHLALEFPPRVLRLGHQPIGLGGRRLGVG